MSDSIQELKNIAKLHKYFWNGLFVALYEPHREQCPVVSLSVEGGKYYIPASESAIKNYLSCKTKMDYDTFLVFCHGIKIDIEKKRILELMPYINRAIAYLDELAFSGKSSRSKTKRQQIFSQVDALSDEGYLWAQQLAQDEKERAEMIELFGSLSQEELSLLHRVADGYPSTCEWDDRFVGGYPEVWITLHIQTPFKSILFYTNAVKTRFDKHNSLDFILIYTHKTLELFL